MQEALPLAEAYHELHAICHEALHGIETDLAHIEEETLQHVGFWVIFCGVVCFLELETSM